jgi:hypothetical protein
MESHFSSSFAAAKPDAPRKPNYYVRGQLPERPDKQTVAFIAASPPDHGTSFSGSGLPFPNMKVAFDNSPNQGEILVDAQNNFEIPLIYPNSYYVALGTLKITPRVYIMYQLAGVVKQMYIELGEGISYRTLSYPPSRKDATFYAGLLDLPVRTQEEILRDSAFPKVDQEHPNFWGLKPPV